jgi:hypothetical protein
MWIHDLVHHSSTLKRLVRLVTTQQQQQRASSSPLRGIYLSTDGGGDGGHGTIVKRDDDGFESHIMEEMQRVTLDDLGLTKKDLIRRPLRSTSNNCMPSRYSASSISLVESREFSLCVFLLEPDHIIPLHDHPNMTVFSRLIQGGLHITAYDWIEDEAKEEDEEKAHEQLRPNQSYAKLVRDEDIFSGIGPASSWTLYPRSHGNLHEFRAIRFSVILDLLMPPYSPGEHRPCSYYLVLEEVTSLPNSIRTSRSSAHESNTPHYLLRKDDTILFSCHERIPHRRVSSDME